VCKPIKKKYLWLVTLAGHESGGGRLPCVRCLSLNQAVSSGSLGRPPPREAENNNDTISLINNSSYNEINNIIDIDLLNIMLVSTVQYWIIRMNFLIQVPGHSHFVLNITGSTTCKFRP